MKCLSDQALLEKVLQHDNAAWREFLSRFRGVVYQCVQRYVNLEPHEVDDVVSDFWYSLLCHNMRRLRSYDPSHTTKTKLSSWLGMIAIQTGINYTRTRGHKASRCTRQLVDEDQEEISPMEAMYPVEEMCLFRERRARLNQLVPFLTQREQQLFRLTCYRGLSIPQAARTMGIKVSTTYTKRKLMVEKLRALMAKLF